MSEEMWNEDGQRTKRWRNDWEAAGKYLKERVQIWGRSGSLGQLDNNVHSAFRLRASLKLQTR